MKTIKFWFLTATSLIILGVMLFCFSACSTDWNFRKLFGQEYDTKTHEITQEFNSFDIDTDTANILFTPSNDGKCTVECFEKEKVNHSVSVQDGKLTIRTIDERKWYDHIQFFDFAKDKITVYLPQIKYADLCIQTGTGDVEILENFSFEDIDIKGSTGDLRIENITANYVSLTRSTGDIHAKNITAKSLALSVSTGNIFAESITLETTLTAKTSTGDARLTNLTCNAFSFDGSTGKVELKNVVATQSFNINNKTGNVTFESCDAGEISVTTSTGDITGSLLSEKIFIVDSGTGRIDVPKTITGGKCELTASTGNIIIQIQP
ncbi:MAG: DUF4097 domain-containing protein [Clostridiales bacterium]|nr:DUF4097 domain-containing protein [Clostridiales bacterium]